MAITASLAAAAGGAAAQRTGWFGGFGCNRVSHSNNLGCRGLLMSHITAGAITGIVGALTAAGKGFTAGQHEIATGVWDGPGGTAAGFP
jgi:hypothetical protein